MTSLCDVTADSVAQKLQRIAILVVVAFKTIARHKRRRESWKHQKLPDVFDNRIDVTFIGLQQ